MIQGKFYTGLPEKMMNRSRGMDRQQTNFFWPDESEAEETPNRKLRSMKAQASPMSSAIVNNARATANDIKPKELFHKQLSSRIEFYDNVDAKTPEARRRRFKKIDNVNLNNLNNSDNQYVPEKKKLETFSSKIEFYDFVDLSAKPTEVKRNNASFESNKQKQKIEIDDEPIKKPIERTDSMKRRISFQVEKATPEKTKSILKNVDGKAQPEKMAVKPLPKRGLLPKSMSKSVDNMSKLAKSTENLDEKTSAEPKSEELISIIREVKNMNLSEQKQPARSSASRNRYVDDYDDNDHNHSRAGNRRTNYQREDEYGRRERDEPRYNSRFDDRYDSERTYDDYNYNERPYRRQQQPLSNRSDRYEDRRVQTSPQQVDDDYYESHTKRYDSSEQHRTPPNRRYHDIDDRSPRHTTRNVPIDMTPYVETNRPIRGHSSQNRMRYEDRPIERKPIDRGQRAYSEQPINYSPADIGRSHRHLRSNIFFNDEIRQPFKRPLSVRDSAVTRVGVGLPDI